MEDPAVIPTAFFFLACPGLLYVGLRRDDLPGPLFLMLILSFIAFAISADTAGASLYWISSITLLVTTVLSVVTVILTRRSRARAEGVS